MVAETIIAAALRIWVPSPLNQEMWEGERVYPNTMIVSAPPPARHHTLLHPMHALGLKHIHPDDQGFLTSKGRFVCRKVGMRIAKEASQVGLKADNPDTLFSEDLW